MDPRAAALAVPRLPPLAVPTFRSGAAAEDVQGP
jgi:hypothetical protein